MNERSPSTTSRGLLYRPRRDGESRGSPSVLISFPAVAGFAIGFGLLSTREDQWITAPLGPRLELFFVFPNPIKSLGSVVVKCQTKLHLDSSNPDPHWENSHAANDPRAPALVGLFFARKLVRRNPLIEFYDQTGRTQPATRPNWSDSQKAHLKSLPSPQKHSQERACSYVWTCPNAHACRGPLRKPAIPSAVKRSIRATLRALRRSPTISWSPEGLP